MALHGDNASRGNGSTDCVCFPRIDHGPHRIPFASFALGDQNNKPSRRGVPRLDQTMHIFIGAVIVGLFATSIVCLKRHCVSASDGKSNSEPEPSLHTPLRSWQVCAMVFLSAPAAIAGADGLITHYLLSESELTSVGLVCAWGALVSNAFTVTILYAFTIRKRPISKPIAPPMPVTPLQVRPDGVDFGQIPPVTPQWQLASVSRDDARRPMITDAVL